jgi:hypothetical protein
VFLSKKLARKHGLFHENTAKNGFLLDRIFGEVLMHGTLQVTQFYDTYHQNLSLGQIFMEIYAFNISTVAP